MDDPETGDNLGILDAFDSRIALLDAKGLITFVNLAWTAAASRLGVAPGELTLGSDFLATCRSDDDDPDARTMVGGIERVLSGAQGEFTLTFASPPPFDDRWYRLEARPLGPRPGVVILVYTDVTDARLANERLRRQKRRFASLIRHSVDLITVMDLNGTVLYQSSTLNPTLGYDQDAAFGRNAFGLVHPEDLAAARRMLAGVASEPLAADCQELRLRHRDGAWRRFEVTLTNLLEDPDVAGIVVNSHDVTERRAAEAAMADRAESFSTLFNATAEAILIHDGRRFVAVNRAHADLLGTGVDDLIGREILDLVSPESRPAALQAIRRGDEVPYELTLLRADGSTFPAELLGRRVRFDGQWVRLLTVRDISRRREAEDALRASKARQELLLRLMQDQREIDDPVGLMYSASEALGRYLKASRVGLFETFPDRTVTFTTSWTDGALEPLEGTFAAADFSVAWRDEALAGRIFSVSDWNDPLTGDSAFDALGARAGIGAPIIRNGRWRAGMYVNQSTLREWTPDETALVREVADLTWDAVERVRAERALRESEARFRTVWDATADAIALSGPDGVVLAANPAYLALYGFDETEIVGQSFAVVFPEEQRAWAEARHREVFRGAELAPAYVSMVQRKDGAERGVEARADLVLTDGQPTALVSVIRDVTDRLASEAALRHSEARFRALVQEASDIVIVFEPGGELKYANPALERVLGHPVESYRAGLRLDIVHPDDQETVVRTWRAVTEFPGAQFQIAYRCLNADGAWVWLEGVATNLIDLPAVGGVVLNARDASEPKRLEAELRRLALHDPLTGVPNRTLLADRLDYALRQAAHHGHHVAILVLDLDHFKHVNDAFGHTAGDNLLRSVTARLTSVLRVSETVARVGGDEFVVLLPRIAEERDATDVAARLQSAIAPPFVCANRNVHVGVTIGIAIAEAGLMRGDVLLRDGDAALYSAKRAGRGASVVYRSGTNGLAERRWGFRTDLRDAAARGEFVLHYQPIVDLATGQVSRVEALIRWRHPVHGLVQPDEFIPIAEEAGHILSIGRWVIEEVCRQLRLWGPAGPAIAINLPAAQFTDPNLAPGIRASLTTFGIEAHRLWVEMTEHTLVDDLAATVSTLEQLRQLGVGMAIDDFGTGYSSLRYLRELPVDSIKLDRSFAYGLESSPGALAIVEGITSLAHAIGLTVTAEGIESAGQLTRLRAVGCDRGQGFYLARPAPAGERPPVVTIPWPADHTGTG